MPLFQVELNRVADDIGASTLTIRLPHRRSDGRRAGQRENHGRRRRL